MIWVLSAGGVCMVFYFVGLLIDGFVVGIGW